MVAASSRGVRCHHLPPTFAIGNHVSLGPGHLGTPRVCKLHDCNPGSTLQLQVRPSIRSAQPMPIVKSGRAVTERPGFDADGFYRALDAVRIARKLNWKQVAAEAGVSPSTLTRLAQGRRPDVDSLAALVPWAGLDANAFVARAARESVDDEEGLALISTYLRADRNLSPQAADAIDRVVKAAYEALRDT